MIKKIAAGMFIATSLASLSLYADGSSSAISSFLFTGGTGTGPGMSLSAPAAFGANWGQAYFGIGGAARTATSSDVGGSAVAGVGLGNASKYVGVDANVSIISVNPSDGGAANEGSVSMKMFRYIPEGQYAMGSVAIGEADMLPWGDVSTTLDPSTYVAYSQYIQLPSNFSFLATLGAGNGQFRNPSQLNGNASAQYAFFTSGAIQYKDLISAIVDYTAQNFSAGVSLVPTKWPVSITLGMGNLNHGSGPNDYFMGSVGYLYSF